MHTVFELTHPALGAQTAIAGGGRYELFLPGQNRPVPGVGFAAGVERLLLARQALAKETSSDNAVAYFVGLTPEMRVANLALANRLREAGLKIALELEERSFKAQLRGANKSGAKFAVIRGESEAEKGVAMVKNMADGSQCELPESEIFEYILRNAGVNQ